MCKSQIEYTAEQLVAMDLFRTPRFREACFSIGLRQFEAGANPDSLFIERHALRLMEATDLHARLLAKVPVRPDLTSHDSTAGEVWVAETVRLRSERFKRLETSELPHYQALRAPLPVLPETEGCAAGFCPDKQAEKTRVAHVTLDFSEPEDAEEQETVPVEYNPYQGAIRPSMLPQTGKLRRRKAKPVKPKYKEAHKAQLKVAITREDISAPFFLELPRVQRALESKNERTMHLLDLRPKLIGAS